MISRRTAEALAAAKAKGTVLGNPKIGQARKKAVAEIVDRADQRAANVIPIIRAIQRAGSRSLRQIADALNARGISAPRGGQWYATSGPQRLGTRLNKRLAIAQRPTLVR